MSVVAARQRYVLQPVSFSCCCSFEVTSDNCFLHFCEGRMYLGNVIYYLKEVSVRARKESCFAKKQTFFQVVEELSSSLMFDLGG